MNKYDLNIFLNYNNYYGGQHFEMYLLKCYLKKFDIVILRSPLKHIYIA